MSVKSVVRDGLTVHVFHDDGVGVVNHATEAAAIEHEQSFAAAPVAPEPVQPAADPSADEEQE